MDQPAKFKASVAGFVDTNLTGHMHFVTANSDEYTPLFAAGSYDGSRRQRPATRIFCVKSTPLERDTTYVLLAKAADNSGYKVVSSKVPEDGQVSVCTVGLFTRFLARLRGDLSQDVIVMIDAELSMSAFAAVAHSFLAERLRDIRSRREMQQPAPSLHIFSLGLNDVLVGIYSGLVDAHGRYQLPGIVEKPLNSQRFTDDDLTMVCEEAIQTLRNQKHVLAFAAGNLAKTVCDTSCRALPGTEVVEVTRATKLGEIGQRLVSQRGVIFVLPDRAFDYPLGINNLGLVICGTPWIMEDQLSRSTGLIVSEGRRQSKMEYTAQFAYAGTPGQSDIRFLVQDDNVDDGDDDLEASPPPRYLSGEIMSFAFLGVYFWPKRNLANTAKAFNLADEDREFLGECYRRLPLMQIARKEAEGLVCLQPKGNRIWQLLQDQVPFNAAALLACVDPLPNKLQRLLIRLGVIVTASNDLVAAEPASAVRDAREFAELLNGECIGPAKSKVHSGYLWRALGLWENMCAHTNYFQQRSAHGLHSSAVLSVEAAEAVYKTVSSYEAVFELKEANAHGWLSPLNDSESSIVSQMLTRAFFDRLVSLPVGEPELEPIQLMSGFPIQIWPSPLFDYEELKKTYSPDAPGVKHLLGFALRFVAGKDGEVFAIGVTLVPHYMPNLLWKDHNPPRPGIDALFTSFHV